MLSGLKKDQAKMSKSDPNSAIYMEDSREEVESKIKKAFCEEKNISDNPILEYCRNIIFPSIGYFELKRPGNNDGNMYK
jgi:tyrosyl-tRNA synthetase